MRSENNPLINALKAFAVGDAVGYPLEFLPSPTREDFGKVLKQNQLCISDDTQMTLFGFEGVFNDTPIESYLNWYKTQHDRYVPIPGLANFEELWVTRAPGTTCIRGLYQQLKGTPLQHTGSEGCGSVMRLLPVVLLFDEYDLDHCIEYALKISRITHPNANVDHAVEKLIKAYWYIYNDLEILDYPEASSITEIGEGWIASEAVDMALWAFRNASTSDELLFLSTCHPGDSDSVGAIACSLWGLSGREVLYFDKVLEQRPIKYILQEMKTYQEFKQTLEEAKSVGIVYHFTKPEYLNMLIDKNFQMRNLGVDTEFTMWAEKGLSLTRNKNLPMMPIAKNDFSTKNGYTIRLVVDGTKLSNKYRILPVAGLEYNQNDPAEVLDIRNRHRTPRRYGESEEFVLPKNGVVNLKDCVVRVDILKDSSTSEEWRDETKNKINALGIECNIVRFFK